MFGDRLKALRELHEMTQKQVADVVKTTDAAVGMWENNKRTPDLKTLWKLADLFGVSIDYLVGRGAESI